MNQHIGIWIDHTSAVIVSASGSQATTRTLESGVDQHPRYSGQSGAGGEKKYEQRHGEQLDRYYDHVILDIGHPEAVLICGPGEAKVELKARLDRSKAFLNCVVDVETSDKLTEPQIVAKVKQHFAVAR